MQILDHWPTTQAKPTGAQKQQLYEAVGNLVIWDSAQVIKTHENHTWYRKWSGFNPLQSHLNIRNFIGIEEARQNNSANYLKTILNITSSFFLLRQTYWIYCFPNILTLFNVITNNYLQLRNKELQECPEKIWMGLSRFRHHFSLTVNSFDHPVEENWFTNTFQLAGGCISKLLPLLLSTTPQEKRV